MAQRAPSGCTVVRMLTSAGLRSPEGLLDCWPEAWVPRHTGLCSLCLKGRDAHLPKDTCLERQPSPERPPSVPLELLEVSRRVQPHSRRMRSHFSRE